VKRFAGFFHVTGLRNLYRVRSSTRTALDKKKNDNNQNKNWLKFPENHKQALLITSGLLKIYLKDFSHTIWPDLG
jgi:hypothetical protein